MSGSWQAARGCRATASDPASLSVCRGRRKGDNRKPVRSCLKTSEKCPEQREGLPRGGARSTSRGMATLHELFLGGLPRSATSLAAVEAGLHDALCSECHADSRSAVKLRLHTKPSGGGGLGFGFAWLADEAAASRLVAVGELHFDIDGVRTRAGVRAARGGAESRPPPSSEQGLERLSVAVVAPLGCDGSLFSSSFDKWHECLKQFGIGLELHPILGLRAADADDEATRSHLERAQVIHHCGTRLPTAAVCCHLTIRSATRLPPGCHLSCHLASAQYCDVLLVWWRPPADGTAVATEERARAWATRARALGEAGRNVLIIEGDIVEDGIVEGDIVEGEAGATASVDGPASLARAVRAMAAAGATAGASSRVDVITADEARACYDNARQCASAAGDEARELRSICDPPCAISGKARDYRKAVVGSPAWEVAAACTLAVRRAVGRRLATLLKVIVLSWTANALAHPRLNLATLNRPRSRPRSTRTALSRPGHPACPCPQVYVSDCDGTLWAGAVSEEGPGGVSFGRGRLALQRALSQLQRRGRLVCLASKNDEADVLDVFAQRGGSEGARQFEGSSGDLGGAPSRSGDLGRDTSRSGEMALQFEQITAREVHWQPKERSLRRLATSLELPLQAFVFLDDRCSPFRVPPSVPSGYPLVAHSERRRSPLAARQPVRGARGAHAAARSPLHPRARRR